MKRTIVKITAAAAMALALLALADCGSGAAKAGGAAGQAAAPGTPAVPGNQAAAGVNQAAAASGASGQGSAAGSQGGAPGAGGQGASYQGRPGTQGGGQGGAPGAGGQSGAPGAGGQGGGRRSANIPVQVAAIPSGTLLADRDTAGVLTPAIQSSIAVPVGGIVAKVLLGAGEWVKAGTVVVQLDDSLLRIAAANAKAAVDTAKINLQTTQGNATDSLPRFQLQVDSAQASVNSAQRNYDSQKALFDLGGLSASALDTAGGQLATAKANLETAKLALDQARKGIATTPGQNVDALKIAIMTAQNNLDQAKYNLDHAAIKAPFDGQISTMNASPGMYLGQNAAAFVLVSSERQVSFSIAPSDAVAMRKGMALTWEIAGKAYAITLKQDPSTPINGSVPLTARLDELTTLPFGSIGNVSYLIELARGPIVPLTAVATMENQNYVLLVNGGKVETRNIMVMAESGIVAAVTGVAAGAMVILSPPPGLVPGAQVQSIATPFPQTAAIRPDGERPALAATVGGKTGNQRTGAQAAGGAAPGAPAGATQAGARGGGATGQWSGQRPGTGQGSPGTGTGQGGASTGQGGTGAGQPGQWTGRRQAGQGSSGAPANAGQGSAGGQAGGQTGPAPARVRTSAPTTVPVPGSTGQTTGQPAASSGG
ncbi:MAG: HlyD family efflux transporter periplasmic adaptor subunit [Spirochaetota bacterium]